MNAAVLHTYGATPQYQQFPEPEPNAHEAVVTIKAASLKMIDRAMAAGTHYDQRAELPRIVGIDGVGVMDDGARIYTGGCRPPYGTMAERTVIPAAFRIQVPDDVDDLTAATLPNPALSSWLPLVWRAQLQPGETVLILGATGVAGKLAVQIARHLGAGRIVGAGRNEAELERMESLGADAVIRLAGTRDDIAAAFAREAREHPVDIVLDYLWGMPAEALLQALTGHDVMAESNRIRYVEIGAMAGPAIALDAATLRSSGLELYGSGGGSMPHEVIFETIPQVLQLAAEGTLQIDTEPVPLADVAAAWRRDDLKGRRLVIVP